MQRPTVGADFLDLFREIHRIVERNQDLCQSSDQILHAIQASADRGVLRSLGSQTLWESLDLLREEFHRHQRRVYELAECLYEQEAYYHRLIQPIPPPVRREETDEII